MDKPWPGDLIGGWGGLTGGEHGIIYPDGWVYKGEGFVGGNHGITYEERSG